MPSVPVATDSTPPGNAAPHLPDTVQSHARERLIGLDLLRAIAAYMVVIAHCAPALVVLLGTGAVFYTNFLALAGVELFFALSGFLIGGILLDLPPTADNLRRFVLRRWYRTLPVYYCALLLYLSFPSAFHPMAAAEPWRYFVFLQNMTNDPKFFGVSWSLAIEEWFYLLLPLCLWVRIRYLGAIALIIGTGIALRYALPVDTRASVLGRLDAIGYGCLVAWLMRKDLRAFLERHALLLAFAALAGMFVFYGYAVLERMRLTRLSGTVLFTALPLFAAMTLPYFAGLKIRTPLVARAAIFGAAISYPLYVFHNELIYALGHTFLHSGTGLPYLVAVLAGTTAFAYVIHVMVERPFMRLRPAATGAQEGLPLPGRP
jgi:peptidoglycan/LPS O-acetylase OafA/YrhL